MNYSRQSPELLQLGRKIKLHDKHVYEVRVQPPSVSVLDKWLKTNALPSRKPSITSLIRSMDFGIKNDYLVKIENEMSFMNSRNSLNETVNIVKLNMTPDPTEQIFT